MEKKRKKKENDFIKRLSNNTTRVWAKKWDALWGQVVRLKLPNQSRKQSIATSNIFFFFIICFQEQLLEHQF